MNKEREEDDSKFLHLLILFGGPGAGKSTVGKILEDDYNFHFYDADIDFTHEMLERSCQGMSFTDEMRAEWTQIIYRKIESFRGIHKDVAVAVPLLKGQMRTDFLTRFTEAKLVLINVPKEERIKRIKQREQGEKEKEAAIKGSEEFEDVKEECLKLRNETLDSIRLELQKLINTNFNI